MAGIIGFDGGAAVDKEVDCFFEVGLIHECRVVRKERSWDGSAGIERGVIPCVVTFHYQI